MKTNTLFKTYVRSAFNYQHKLSSGAYRTLIYLIVNWDYEGNHKQTYLLTQCHRVNTGNTRASLNKYMEQLAKLNIITCEKDYSHFTFSFTEEFKQNGRELSLYNLRRNER